MEYSYKRQGIGHWPPPGPGTGTRLGPRRAGVPFAGGDPLLLYPGRCLTGLISSHCSVRCIARHEAQGRAPSLFVGGPSFRTWRLTRWLARRAGYRLTEVNPPHIPGGCLPSRRSVSKRLTGRVYFSSDSAFAMASDPDTPTAR